MKLMKARRTHRGQHGQHGQGKFRVWKYILILGVILTLQWVESNRQKEHQGEPTAPVEVEWLGPTTEEHPDTVADWKKQVRGWTQIKKGKLTDWGGNDGDSFSIRFPDGKRVVYRLYNVDTCETSDRYEDRLRYQARYFDIELNQVNKAGEVAKRATLERLRTEPFTVWTKSERVMDSERVHAMIELNDGEFLCEWLVRNGLARIYTMPSDTPDGRSKKEFIKHLKELEQVAKKNREGLWGW